MDSKGGEGRISTGEFPSSDGAQNATKTCHSIYQIKASKVRNRNIPLIPIIVAGVGWKMAWKARVRRENWAFRQNFWATFKHQ
ncbi:hypothetical protein DVH24_033426 [Malus domestica]|uniref:Uncharacterized protein n=1 Tax=Malus domestica TaxID=3750 RepID=A0A498JAP3_MALDO|nr:hypothetical protein DVH24_033426 [Malus domestica]